MGHARLAQMLGELSQAQKPSRVHVEVVLVLDVLLVALVDLDALRAPAPAQERDKLGLEARAVVVDVLARLLPDDEHLPQVRLGRGVALEPVLCG